jgi:hypothetical protein
MAKKPLRSQLNQIRAWVRQGRTDAWIAHQLEVSASELREFRRRHDLSADGEEGGETDLRDEIEAELEAATREVEEPDEEEDEDEDEEEDEEEEGDEEEEAEEDEREGEEVPSEVSAAAAPGAEEGEGEEGRPRRRRRRGGRRRGRRRGLEATFDHGEKDGFGLWLDPAVQDDPVYSEHWAGHRQVEVTIEAEQIVIRRSD